MALEKQYTCREAATVRNQVSEVRQLREQSHEAAAVTDQVSKMSQFKERAEKRTEQVATLS